MYGYETSLDKGRNSTQTPLGAVIPIVPWAEIQTAVRLALLTGEMIDHEAVFSILSPGPFFRDVISILEA